MKHLSPKTRRAVKKFGVATCVAAWKTFDESVLAPRWKEVLGRELGISPRSVESAIVAGREVETLIQTVDDVESIHGRRLVAGKCDGWGTLGEWVENKKVLSVRWFPDGDGNFGDVQIRGSLGGFDLPRTFDFRATREQFDEVVELAKRFGYLATPGVVDLTATAGV